MRSTSARAVLALTSIAAVTACSARGPATMAMRPVDIVERLYSDDGAGITDSSRRVARTASEYKALWREATRAQRTEPEAPSIDFSRAIVVLVAAGPSRPGDRIRVDSVATTKRELAIVVRTTLACQPLPGTVYPIEMVALPKPRADAVLSFVERRDRARDCAE
ncbi:MAG: hypothetical protein MUF00_12170 [Gemmatimonadaceae bacterium]|nr:hypothetical protein [Gemmatimonadaceae bacterium]